jgi:hypothetical protein
MGEHVRGTAVCTASPIVAPQRGAATIPRSLSPSEYNFNARLKNVWTVDQAKDFYCSPLNCSRPNNPSCTCRTWVGKQAVSHKRRN